MAKSKISIDKRMRAIGRRAQSVNAKSRVFKEKYLTEKGKKLLAKGVPEEEVFAKYQKSRYVKADDSRVKILVHRI